MVPTNDALDSAADFLVEPYSESSQLARRWEVLRGYPLVIVGLILAGIAAAGFIESRRGLVYRAASTVRFQDKKASLTSGVGTQLDANYYNDIDPVKSQTELISSRTIIDRAIDAGQLQMVPIGSADLNWISDLEAKNVTKSDTLRLGFSDSSYAARFGSHALSGHYGAPVQIGEVHFTVPSKPPAATAAFAVSTKAAVEAALSEVLVTRRTDTNLADLSLAGHDPVLVQRSLNALTRALQAQSRESDQHAARDRRVFLDEQLRKADSVLETQRAQLTAFRVSKRSFSSRDKILLAQQTLASIRTRREELAADRQVFMTLLAGALKARDNGDASRLRTLIGAPGLSSNPLIADLYSQLNRATQARDSLTNGPSASAATNPDVQRVNAQIESTTAQFISAIQNQINTFDARISALDDLGTRTAADVSSLPATEAEEQRLSQDVDATQKLADQLREEQQRARISEVAQGGEVEIIDLARRPIGPEARKLGTRLFLGGLAGLFLAIVVIFLYDELDTSLRRKRDVESLLGLSTLGSIPSLTPGSNVFQRNFLRRAKSSNGVALKPIGGTSSIHESIRGVRTSLIFSNAVQSLRSIAITSASPSEGKSTTTASLAISFAEQNLRVLVIDCDLRRGTLHRVFGVQRIPGLTNAIATGAPLQAVIQPTAFPNLSIITTGLQPPNPGELLGSARLNNLLLEAQELFDLVLIDTPPMLAAADSSIVASMVDGVVLLIRVGSTRKAAAKAAQERLHLVGARVLGTVLNDPNEMLQASDEYYYYDYSSHKASN